LWLLFFFSSTAPNCSAQVPHRTLPLQERESLTSFAGNLPFVACIVCAEQATEIHQLCRNLGASGKGGAGEGRGGRIVGGGGEAGERGVEGQLLSSGFLAIFFQIGESLLYF
jgi:hypothetical protein